MCKQDIRPLHLFCQISFLQKSFVEELAEKWLHNCHLWSIGDFGTHHHMLDQQIYPKIATFDPESAARADILYPPTSGNSSFLPHSPYLLDIWMQIVPPEAAHLFDLNAAIMGWLLADVQSKKQLLWHSGPKCQHLFCLD